MQLDDVRRTTDLTLLYHPNGERSVRSELGTQTGWALSEDVTSACCTTHNVGLDTDRSKGKADLYQCLLDAWYAVFRHRIHIPPIFTSRIHATHTGLPRSLTHATRLPTNHNPASLQLDPLDSTSSPHPRTLSASLHQSGSRDSGRKRCLIGKTPDGIDIPCDHYLAAEVVARLISTLFQQQLVCRF
ncbi:unnamed protein product [Protopolystoma xenopodis]|uniref:Uncharacterized protein n=1 Tax=Protopolystoma xenopodis TaxID=117903 RepID=A0A448WMN6_9PLAT|nr:unnamed protein product [Protopolystoma xenopodis]